MRTTAVAVEDVAGTADVLHQGVDVEQHGVREEPEARSGLEEPPALLVAAVRRPEGEGKKKKKRRSLVAHKPDAQSFSLNSFVPSSFFKASF